MSQAGPTPATVHQIGPFRLDTEAPALTRDGAPVPLGQRATAVLAVLVRSAQQYVPKGRIMQAVWPGMVVEESNLAVQISAIRRVLAQVPGGELWLETLPRRGYRFRGPVDAAPPVARAAPEAGTTASLPEPPTSFVGRERELAEIDPLLSRARIVTLIGAGGTGKSRLALRAAAAAAGRFPDGVRLVELAALNDPALVPQSVATALGVAEGPGRTLTQTVVECLAASRTLLLLDNAEHLVAAVAQLATEIARRCAGVVVLVTSRERLAIDGELTFRVPSLSSPGADVRLAPEPLARYESVRLFVDRAQFQRPDFAVTADNAPAIASVCRRLDGIPLAIELAAARMRSMSVAELNDRLDERFHVLTGGSRTALPRQQTLRSLIDWSYDLLTAKEQALFQRLAVFAGGFTLPAAEHACAGAPVDGREVLDVLTSLVDRSLASADTRGGATRYDLLETVRQYAADRLRESGEGAQWRARHAAHFRDLALEAEPKLRGPEQRAWLDRLDAEHDNLRAAVAWYLDAHDGAGDALRLAGALWRFWYVRGFLEEGRTALGAALAAPSSRKPTSERAKALYGAGGLARRHGDYAAAKALHEEGLAIERTLGDSRGLASALNSLGIVAYELGDFDAARALYEEGLALRRRADDRWGVAVLLNNLGIVIRHRGDLAAARAIHGESHAIFHNLGDQQGMAFALSNQAFVACEQGDYAAARRLATEALSAFRGVGDRWGMAWSLEALAEVALATGAPETSAKLWGGAAELRTEIGCPLPPSELPRCDRQVAAARAASPDAAAFERAWAEGRAMTQDALAELALAQREA